MMFEASTKEHKIEEDNNSYKLYYNDEVELVEGWKKVSDIVVGDRILIRYDDSEQTDILEVKNIINEDKYVYVS